MGVDPWVELYSVVERLVSNKFGEFIWSLIWVSIHWSEFQSRCPVLRRASGWRRVFEWLARLLSHVATPRVGFLREFLYLFQRPGWLRDRGLCSPSGSSSSFPSVTNLVVAKILDSVHLRAK